MNTDSSQAPQLSVQPVPDHLVQVLQQLSLPGVGGPATQPVGLQLCGASVPMVDPSDVGLGMIDAAGPAATAAAASVASFSEEISDSWAFASVTRDDDAVAPGVAPGDTGGPQAAGDSGEQSWCDADAGLPSVVAFQSAFPGLHISDVARALGISMTQLKRRWERHLVMTTSGSDSAATALPSDVPPRPSGH